MLHRAARNAYSWWWASHIRTKQSKWLDQNMHDMEEKVEYILKIINEEGDSFAVRAEMYYRKRPELVNFVEDCFRNYRALAERYDHLSRELQSANRTIATVFPESVQMAMEEDDEESFSASSNFFQEAKQPTGGLPAAPPKLSIPRIVSIIKKNSKSPSRMMSKKGLLKMNGVDDLMASKSSGLTKEEALREIDKLQKGILGLQTEKEFVKSSYESGMSKYWDIEKQVTEMQASVSNLEDEFGIGTVIEDDEARSLMASTALKSCKETLLRLQAKQEQMADEARVEHRRVQEAREKFEALIAKVLSNQTLPREHKSPNPSPSLSPSTDLEDSVRKERHDTELLREKIKDQLLANGDKSLTVSELAENIDELVDKVINLETEVSSQSALVKRLRSEANQLQAHLWNLEEGKESLIGDSDKKSEKIRELEEELCRVQSLNNTVRDQNKNLEARFTKASCNLDLLSEKLPTVKPDEEVERRVLFKEERDVQGVNLEKQFQAHEDTASPKNVSEILISVKTKEGKKKDSFEEQRSSVKGEDKEYLLQLNLSNPFVDPPPTVPEANHRADLSQKGQVRAVLDGFQDQGFKESEHKMEEETETEKDCFAGHSASIKAGEENFVPSNQSKYLDDLLGLGQVKAVPYYNPQEGLKEHEDANMGTEKENSFPSNSSNHLNGHSVQGEVRAGPEKGSKFREDVSTPYNGSMNSKEEKKADEDKRAEEKEKSEDLVHHNQSNQKDDLSAKSREPKKQDLLHTVGSDAKEVGSNEEDQPNWRQLFLNGLDDRERTLVEEYTSLLGNYKQVKKKLSEVENKNRASLFKSIVQIKVLTSANASKDAEIKSLHRKLNLFITSPDETMNTHESTSITSPGETLNTHESKSNAALQISHTFSPKSNQKTVPALGNLSGEQSVKPTERTEESTAEKCANISITKEEEEYNKEISAADEPHIIPTIDEKIRMDIDDLLEENIEFWLRFSTSVHQIKKFQTSFQDLQAELTKVTEMKNQDGSTTPKSSDSDIRAIYRHLREIETELTLWMEHNSVLRGDLQNRLLSLCSIQEEITRLSDSGSQVDETELSDYQAAKFQGEVMNMKQENNKIAGELLAGLDRGKRLKVEIERTLEKLDEELGISIPKNHRTKNPVPRSKIPLRSFLFGVKLKKQKPSLFACMSPQLQRQYSDLSAFPM